MEMSRVKAKDKVHDLHAGNEIDTWSLRSKCAQAHDPKNICIQRVRMYGN
jgi:hypothetical protein